EQPLRQLRIHLVRDDRVVGMEEALELLLGRRDEPRVRVPDVEAADAAGEVDEDVAVQVGERCPRASATTIGNAGARGAATLASSRKSTSCERGPGTSVRTEIVRVVAMTRA